MDTTPSNANLPRDRLAGEVFTPMRIAIANGDLDFSSSFDGSTITYRRPIRLLEFDELSEASTQDSDSEDDDLAASARRTIDQVRKNKCFSVKDFPTPPRIRLTDDVFSPIPDGGYDYFNFTEAMNSSSMMDMEVDMDSTMEEDNVLINAKGDASKTLTPSPFAEANSMMHEAGWDEGFLQSLREDLEIRKLFLENNADVNEIPVALANQIRNICEQRLFEWFQQRLKGYKLTAKEKSAIAEPYFQEVITRLVERADDLMTKTVKTSMRPKFEALQRIDRECAHDSENETVKAWKERVECAEAKNNLMKKRIEDLLNAGSAQLGISKEELMQKVAKKRMEKQKVQ